MWLIDTTTLKLRSFHECPTGAYAILSHTWSRSPDDELNFVEFEAGAGRGKIGFQKIQKCCEQARKDGLHYAWVDTCCIDKRSSSELSEAINSMFNWYARASKCYAYLADVPDTSFEESLWFTRGWTLQELLAPKAISFYTRDWTWLGDEITLARELQAITSIEPDVFTSNLNYRSCSVAQRMSWASKRVTTRVEDSAYCLIGLFNVNIPLLYGEGSRAFIRLQEEILRQTDDETIFAWEDVSDEGSGLLAPSPANFRDSANIVQGKPYRERRPYAQTNRGLEIECEMLPCEMNTYIVPLNCERRQASSPAAQIAILLCRTSQDHQYRRIPSEGMSLGTVDRDMSRACMKTIFVPADARMLALAPHSGLPIIHIESNLQAWKLSASESPTFTGPVADDLESGARRRDEVGAFDHVIDTRLPQKVTQTQVKYLDHTLIAFTRLPATGSEFYYYVEVGFDLDFKPVLILHARRFHWLPASLPMLSQLEDTARHRLPMLSQLGDISCRLLSMLLWFPNILSRSSKQILPMCGSLFTDARCEGRDFMMGDFSTRPLIHRVSCAKCGAHKTRRPHTWVQLRTGGREKHRDPRIWRFAGDRKDGLEGRLDDILPYSYGCVNLEISFRPQNANDPELNWRLKIHEEPLHPDTLLGDGVQSRLPWQGVVCWGKVAIIVARAPLLLLSFGALLLLFAWFLCSTLGHLYFSSKFHVSYMEAAWLFVVIFVAPGFTLLARSLALLRKVYKLGQRIVSGSRHTLSSDS
jgi:hypothetical protein